MTASTRDQKRGGNLRKEIVSQRTPASMEFVSQFMNETDTIELDRVADAFHMTKAQLAETIGLSAATLSKSDRRTAPRAQHLVREMLEIIARVREWAGGNVHTLAWYRAQPIPALDGRTAEALVKQGKAAAVQAYLEDRKS